jgi:hypothetical protein
VRCRRGTARRSAAALLAVALPAVTLPAVALLAGCSLRYDVHLAAAPEARPAVRPAIETCLASIGTRDVSDVWPQSDYIARWPDEVVAIWESPPIERTSWWYWLLGTSPPDHPYCRAWIRPRGDTFGVTFRGSDSCAPDFAACVRSSGSGIAVEIERDWVFDPS